MTVIPVEVEKVMRTIKSNINDEKEKGPDSYPVDNWLQDIISGKLDDIDSRRQAIQPLTHIGHNVPSFSNRGWLKRKVLRFFSRVFLKMSRLFTRDQAHINQELLNIVSEMSASIKIITSDVNDLKRLYQRIGHIETRLDTLTSNGTQGMENLHKDILNNKITSERDIAKIRQDVLDSEHGIAELRQDVLSNKFDSEHDIAELRQDILSNKLDSEQQRADLDKDVSTVKELYLTLCKDYNNMRASVNESKARFNYYLSKKIEQHSPADPEKYKQLSDQLNDDFYYDYKIRFGSSKEYTSKLLSFYLTYTEELDKSAVIVDIGCGMGEWMSLLVERGFSPIGIDINNRMVRECISHGLNVLESDAIAYLSGLSDNSVDLLTSFQVIEHVDFEYLYRLIQESFRVLKPNGVIIFETPNPFNLKVSACSFYIDPTHLKPVHPLPLSFCFEQCGFMDYEIVHQADEEFNEWWRNVEKLDVNGPRISRLDAIIPELHEVLRSDQNYALVARKGNA